MIRPFCYDPSWSRSLLWDVATEYIHQAAREWSIPQPQISASPFPGGQKYSSGGKFYGHWLPPDKIWVNVAASTPPVKTRGRIWSYPGYKVDRTCAGILAHEFGHHCAGSRRLDAPLWRQIARVTKPVTGYEPTPDESWAESMRIFILNPDLLRCARPQRFHFIAEYFPPLHDAPWREVLANAPAFLLEYAERFCTEGAQAVL